MAKKANGDKNGNGHGKIGHNRGVLRLYRSYNYVDKDPAIDKLRTVVKDEKCSEKNLAILSGVSSTTIDNWFNGKTRRPQHTTLAAAAAALGYDWNLSQIKHVDIASELPKAVRWQEKRETERHQQRK